MDDKQNHTVPKLYGISFALCILVIVYSIVLFVCIGIGIIRLCIGLIWLICLLRSFSKIKQGTIQPEAGKSVCHAILLLGLIVVLSLNVGAFRCMAAFQYPMQKWYVTTKHGSGDISWMPDTLPASVSEYGGDFLPTILQGDGYFHVHFVCDDADIAAYEAQYSAIAQRCVPLSEASADDALFYDTGFWSNHESTATLYLLEGDGINHPHGSAVVIDKENRCIEFCRTG